MNNFADVIEDVKKLDYQQLQELNFITNKYINEMERDNILKSHKDSLKEYKNGKLEFSSDLDKLKKMLDF